MNGKAFRMDRYAITAMSQYRLQDNWIMPIDHDKEFMATPSTHAAWGLVAFSGVCHRDL
jgi:hypothetical protein